MHMSHIRNLRHNDISIALEQMWGSNPFKNINSKHSILSFIERYRPNLLNVVVGRCWHFSRGTLCKFEVGCCCFESCSEHLRLTVTSIAYNV